MYADVPDGMLKQWHMEKLHSVVRMRPSSLVSVSRTLWPSG